MFTFHGRCWEDLRSSSLSWKLAKVHGLKAHLPSIVGSASNKEHDPVRSRCSSQSCRSLRSGGSSPEVSNVSCLPKLQQNEVLSSGETRSSCWDSTQEKKSAPQQNLAETVLKNIYADFPHRPESMHEWCFSESSFSQKVNFPASGLKGFSPKAKECHTGNYLLLGRKSIVENGASIRLLKGKSEPSGRISELLFLKKCFESRQPPPGQNKQNVFVLNEI